MKDAFAMWSGGKDSHFALFRGIRSGLHPRVLVTFIDADTDLVLAHRIPTELIEEQAALLNIPLRFVRTTESTYERDLRNELFDLRSAGITRGLFGDTVEMDLRIWFESILADVDMRGIFPLWNVPSAHLLREQLAYMRSVIIQIDREISESYLGSDLCREFLEYMMENDQHPGGERGEYHTFVCRSPLMSKEIRLTHAERRATPHYIGLEFDHWSVDSKM